MGDKIRALSRVGFKIKAGSKVCIYLFFFFFRESLQVDILVICFL